MSGKAYSLDGEPIPPEVQQQLDVVADAIARAADRLVDEAMLHFHMDRGPVASIVLGRIIGHLRHELTTAEVVKVLRHYVDDVQARGARQ